ncbi:MAG: pyridoxamine 5'-phosphate oxidase family protein [Candidatus Eisenbacteria bacterium]
MRRTERAVESRAEIDTIIRRSQVCRLGLSDEGQPYIVPLCFGYDGQALYFHCAKDGRKLEILRRNNRVCFEFDIVESMVEAEQGCGWSLRYQSVVGIGTAYPVEDSAGKQRALALLMAQYAERIFSFPPDAVSRTAVIRIEIESLTGKQSKREVR